MSLTPTPCRTPTVIILAAGSGSRFRASGGQIHKLKVLLNRRLVLDHVIAAARESGMPWHVVGAGSGGGAGMGNSIAIGVKAHAKALGWLIRPGDLPLVRPESLLQVARNLSPEVKVVVPRSQGMHGPPVAFNASCLRTLSLLSSNQGAASIVREARFSHQVLDLEQDDEGIVTDIDTVQDLHHASTLMGARRS